MTGEGVLDDYVLYAMGLGSEAGAESGSAILPEVDDCKSFIRGAGSATLYGYFSNWGYESTAAALEWQFPGFYDMSGPEAPNVVFDDCAVEYGDQALAVTGGDFDWSLRDDGWRCAVAPEVYE